MTLTGRLRRLGKPGRLLGQLLDYDDTSPGLQPLPSGLAGSFPHVRRGASWNL